MNFLVIMLGMVFINNFVLAQFLGLCPFLGVSKKTEAALGMGLAVVFVMTLASSVTWFIYTYLLLPGSANLFFRLGLIEKTTSLVDVLKVVSYILVIATLVQLVEMVLRKSVPTLYKALGIYLPLITTNCAVMGVALLNTSGAKRPLSFLEALCQGFFAGVGFLLVMLLMSAIREKLEYSKVPEALRGVPIAFICTSLMAIAFLGFQGLI
jgi:electron transport complex protein RnfA